MKENYPTNEFFLGQNNIDVAGQFLIRNQEADSSSVNWFGFEKSLSYAKTLDGRILHVTQHQKMVELLMDDKITYLTDEEFKIHRNKIEPYLQKINQFGGYWKH
jgi:hypothetical protein